jgi:hypothetical protein
MSNSACRLLLCAVISGAFALVPAANAAGPPLPSSASGKAGAVVPGGRERLLARRAGRGTVVVALRRSDRAVLRSQRIRGRWSVPAVTLDNGTTGLSADGHTLVLARPTHAFPPAVTRLAVLDARRLQVRRHVVLQGFYTVDAISPDGRRLFLLQYGDDVLEYRVRALDTSTGRLAARDIVDPRQPGEQMGGLPMTRAMSRDSRWAYTLYGGGEETFIHALDTEGQTAACIDLDMLPPEGDLSGVQLRVSRDGRRVDVRDGRGLVATVDARTFHVSEPNAAATTGVAAPVPPRRDIAQSADAGGFPWAVLALAAAAAAAAAGLAVVIARRRVRARPGGRRVAPPA